MYADDSTFVDIHGNRWIKPNAEYTVFLSFSGVHGWNYDYNYCYLRPREFLPVTKVGGMFPIYNGVVFDPNNDFGFGTDLTSTQFKTALRQKINQLLNP
jgi:hypothetical protein